MKKYLLPILALFCTGCVGTPENIEPVTGFEPDRYLGTWYEIARLDHRFERGLSNVTAKYSLNEDGTIAVVNRGYNEEEKEWQKATGKAKFVKNKETGHLKVSFFGPFYASYVIFELDKENYQYAYVTGSDKDYLWFLSRTPTISEAEKKRFTETIIKLGFATDELTFVDHDLGE